MSITIIKQGDNDRPAPQFEAHCYGCGSIIGFCATDATQTISLYQPGALTVPCPVCSHTISVRIA